MVALLNLNIKKYNYYDNNIRKIFIIRTIIIIREI